MLDCEIGGYRYTGVAICGRAVATLKRVTFGPVDPNMFDELDNYGEPPPEKVGLNIQGDVQVSADSCKALPGKGAIGAKVLGISSKLSLSTCQMNGIYGVVAMCARLTLKDCSTFGCVIMGVRLVNASGTLTRYTGRSDENVLGCEESVVNAKSCQFVDFSMGMSIMGRTDSVSSFHDCKLAGSGSKGSLPFIRSVGVVINPGKFSVNFRKSVIRHLEDSCIVVQGMQGPLNMHDCEISESSHGCGVEVKRQSAKVVLKRYTIRQNASHGVLCIEGSHVVAERVHSTGNGKAGFGFHDGSRMKLTDCSSVRDTYGVDAVRERVGGDLPEISLRRVFVQRATGRGVSFTGAVNCDVTNCCVLQCGGVGFAAGASKKYPRASNVRLASCRAQRCGQQGVLCMADGNLTVKNTVSVRNGGAGFACCDKESEMQLVGCRSKGDADDFFRDDKAKLRISK